MKILKSILVWFCFIPAAILNGGLRELLLNPVLGKELALPVSGVTLSLFIFVIARLLLPRIGQMKKTECYAISILWLMLTVLFEYGLSVSSGISAEELLRVYNPLTGNLWLLAVLVTALSPIVFMKRNKK